MLRIRSASMLAAVAALSLLVGTPSVALGQHKAFPDAFFFPDRPAGLKGLEGKPAPELKLKSWIGTAVKPADMKGKVVVIDFWATWCGPCMAAIPHNIELVKKHKSDGLVFIGVHDSNSGWDRAQGVVNDKGINYPVAVDDAGASTKAFNLGFWPTYVVIDRRGVVRGAGLVPAKVDEAVKLLLAEAGPAGGGDTARPSGEFPDDWYYGGGSRPSSPKALEGKPMPALAAAKWIKEPLTAADAKDRVVVLHFLSVGNPASMKQAETLAALEKEMGPQGVVVVGIGTAGDSWEALTKLAEEGKLPSRLCQDAAGEPSKEEPKPGAKPQPVLDATAAAYGVRYLPATIVIDRTGKVRATSIRAERVKELASKLLAENTNKPAGENPK